MAIIKKNTNNKCWHGHTEKGTLKTLTHCWLGHKFVQSLWKAVQRFLKKLKTEVLYDLHLHSRVYIGKNQNYSFERTMYRHVHSTVTDNC